MAKEADGGPEGRVKTTLGKETVFIGTLKFTDSLKIDGVFEGEIDATGFLWIDKGATVKVRRMRASSILVGGVVHGDIEAVDKIELLPSAKVYGNIRTSKLRIADGVVFEGKCEMIKNPASIDIFSGTKEQVKGSMRL